MYNLNVPKLLVVDDVPSNVLVVTRILEMLDIEIVGAHSGQEALSATLENDFFAIILDVQMPEMDGFEVATILGENPQTRHIPIIFMTAISKDEYFVVKGYQTGAVDYMTKPFNVEILQSKVKIFLNLYLKEQELLYVNRKLSQFTSAASHDLKAPLRHVNAYTKMILEDNDDKLDDETVHNLNAIKKTTKRLYNLIGDLLDYAKLVRKDMPKEEVDLGSVVKEVAENLETLRDECSATFKLNELPKIVSNGAYMRQVFQNLISNALKYRKDDVAPIIEISCDEFNDEANLCKISVKDNGIGFDEQYKEKIFVAFERLVPSSAYEGSGVGLATVQEVLVACGGHISASSVLGEGSIFTVTLPIK